MSSHPIWSDLPKKQVDSLIVGAGPAGYTAAIYLSRYGRQPLLVTGSQPGGQLTLTTEVENFPGFAQPVQGPWLMEQMHQQAIACGTTIDYDTIHTCVRHDNALVCVGDRGIYYCRTLIIATGASTKWLDLPSETYYRGYGVSSCATCDGRFFKNRHVAVVGGGNTAVEEALFLSQHAATVRLIHRRSQLRADQVLQDRLMAMPHVSMMWDHELVEVLGEHEESTQVRRVTGMTLQHVHTQERASYPIDGIFIAIGHTPNSQAFKDLVTVDAEGYIQVNPGTTSTQIPGLFVAGDVQDHIYRQAVTAAGQGCMAAMEAERFLQAHPPIKPSGESHPPGGDSALMSGVFVSG